MSFSINEIQNLASKAARGAGAPPAQAARFGRAVVYHVRAGRAERDILDAIDALPHGPILRFARHADPDHPLGKSYGDAAQNLALPARLSLSQTLLDLLTNEAHKTYVPSSASSRASGAGAGGIDND